MNRASLTLTEIHMPTLRLRSSTLKLLDRVRGPDETYDEAISRFVVLPEDEENADDRGVNFASNPSPASLLKKKRTRARKGTFTPTTALRDMLLQTLQGAGGKLRYADVLHQVGKRLGKSMTDVDREQIESANGPRWQVNLGQARTVLIEEKLMKNIAEAGKGNWELTDKGMAAK